MKNYEGVTSRIDATFAYTTNGKNSTLRASYTIFDPPAVSTSISGGLFSYLRRGISSRKARKDSNMNSHAIHDGQMIFLN